ncbi:MAG: hypothetical protein SFV32_07255 [Opitutaceae bacterium]|nr:hypothetical protein [Opitutaceae bacterium]
MSHKNYRKIPSRILNKLKKLGGKAVVVAAIREIPRAEIDSGIWGHLGLPFAGQRNTVMPPPERGKFSKKNVHGEEIVRKDLPKETRYNYVEAPNWGDEYNGTHEVALPYQHYPRDFVPPRQTTITVEKVRAETNATVYKFSVDEVIKPKDVIRLLECVNLLQENVGYADVFASETDIADYLRSLHVNWEILPPGEKDLILKRLVAGRNVSPEERSSLQDRLDFLATLKPKHYLHGTSGLTRYVGALLRDDCVVFENAEHGNALYLMYEDWKHLSAKSRVDLLSGRFGTNFDRIVHVNGWKKRVRELIAKKLGPEIS